MADLKELVRVARQTGEKRFPTGSLSSVTVVPELGADGSDILHVRFIMPEETVDELDGDTLVGTIVALSRAFQAVGEERRPMVNFGDVRKNELGDPEG